MKNFISNNWKIILKMIGCALLVYIFISKLAAPKTLVEDYVRYGETVKNFDVNVDADPLKDALTPPEWISSDIVVVAIAMSVGILLVCAISLLTTPKKSDKKK